MRQTTQVIPVNSFQHVVGNANKFNLQNQDAKRRGWSVLSLSSKTDFDNFFGNIKRHLVIAAWKWAESTFIDIFGRRRAVIVIPKQGKRRMKSKTAAFSRSFSMHIRQQAYNQSFPRKQSNTKVSSDDNCMWIQDVIDVILVEFKTAMLKVGSRLAAWTEGITQGSNLANGIAMVVGAFLEKEAYSIREVGAKFFTRSFIQR